MDWNAAGVTFRELEVTLGFGHRAIADGDWYAYADYGGEVHALAGYGHTPNEAVCDLLQSLARGDRCRTMR